MTDQLLDVIAMVDVRDAVSDGGTQPVDIELNVSAGEGSIGVDQPFRRIWSVGGSSRSGSIDLAALAELGVDGDTHAPAPDTPQTEGTRIASYIRGRTSASAFADGGAGSGRSAPGSPSCTVTSQEVESEARKSTAAARQADGPIEDVHSESLSAVAVESDRHSELELTLP